MSNSTPAPAAQKSDFSDLVNLLSALTDAENQLGKLQAKLNQKHLATVRKHAGRYKELQTLIGATRAGLEVIAARNPDWFEEKKTLATPYGEVKRTSSTKLVIADELATIGMIRGVGREDDFLEIKTTIRREVLETLADDQLAMFGVRRETTHNYKPEPAAIDLGKAVKAIDKADAGPAKKVGKKAQAAAVAALVLFLGAFFTTIATAPAAVAAPEIAAPNPPLAPLSSAERRAFVEYFRGAAAWSIQWGDWYSYNAVDRAAWYGQAVGLEDAAYYLETYTPNPTASLNGSGGGARPIAPERRITTMNVRDPLFTARLEQALCLLANQPSRMLSYIENRYDLETGDLQKWLDEFNGGQKALKLDRIYAVKRELGGLTEKKKEAPAAIAAAPAAPASVPAPRPVVPSPAKAKETPVAAAPTANGTAALIDDGESPWVYTSRQFRAKVYEKWRPVLAELSAGAQPNIAEFCTAAGVTVQACSSYCDAWLGTYPTKTAPGKFQRFVEWADTQVLATKEGPRPASNPARAEVPAAPAVAESRASPVDAVAALIALKIKPGEARRRVEAIVDAGKLPATTEELVKLALQNPAISAASVPAVANGGPVNPKRSRTSDPAGARETLHALTAPVLTLGGTSFRIVMDVRLEPLGSKEAT